MRSDDASQMSESQNDESLATEGTSSAAAPASASPRPAPLPRRLSWLGAGVRRGSLSRKLIVVATLLAVLFAGASSVFALAGGQWRGGWGQAGASVAATATASPTPSPTFEPTATLALTATATHVGPWPTDGIDLGCVTTALHPPSYVVRGGATNTNAVALTFDDGPSPDWTANILTTLETTHTPATFFVVGGSVRAYPDLIKREVADGNVLAIHTWDHPYMTKLSPDARAWELAHTAQAIHTVLGPDYCLPYWRPPFGDYNADVLAQAHAMTLTTVTWNVDPADWSSPGVQVIVSRVLSAAHPGAIILMHDGYFHRKETAEALPLVIQGLCQRGLVPVTLPVLLSGQVQTPPSPTSCGTAPTPTATATP